MILIVLSNSTAAVQWNTHQAWRLEALRGINNTGVLDDQSRSGTRPTLDPVCRDELEGSRFSGHRTCHEYDDAWERRGNRVDFMVGHGVVNGIKGAFPVATKAVDQDPHQGRDPYIQL